MAINQQQNCFDNDIALRIQKDIENLLSDNPNDDDSMAHNNDISWDRNVSMNNCIIIDNTGDCINDVDSLSVQKSMAELNIWQNNIDTYDPTVMFGGNNGIESNQIYLNHRNNDDDHGINTNMAQNIFDNHQPVYNENWNQFLMNINHSMISKLENYEINDYYFNHQQIDYILNEYNQSCLLEIQRLDDEINYSILKQQSLNYGKNSMMDKSQRSNNSIEMNNKTKNQRSDQTFNNINPKMNQNQFLIRNAMNLYAKLSSFYNDSSFEINICPNNLQKMAEYRSTIVQLIIIWYNVIENIKKTLEQQQQKNNQLMYNLSSIFYKNQHHFVNCNNDDNEFKQKQIIQMKLLWQLTRKLRLFHWIYDF